MVTILVMVVLLMMPAMMDFVLLIEIRFFGGLPVARFGQIHVVIFQLLRKGASLLSRELVIFCGLFHVRSVDAQLVLEDLAAAFDGLFGHFGDLGDQRAGFGGGRRDSAGRVTERLGRGGFHRDGGADRC